MRPVKLMEALTKRRKQVDDVIGKSSLCSIARVSVYFSRSSDANRRT